MIRRRFRANEGPSTGLNSVVYLAGWGRSGSTILGAILGQYSECQAVGELRHVFAPGVRCGCGVPVEECRFWTSVVARVETELGGIDRQRFLSYQEEVMQPKQVLDILGGGSNSKLRYVQQVKDALYRAICAQARARVVIDSSKHPADVALLTGVEGATVSIVHLVRDPRATSYSWNRRRRPGQQRLGTLAAAGRWMEWNLLTELVLHRVGGTRGIRVRYEDLVRQPDRTIGTVLELIAVTEPISNAIVDRIAILGPNHMVHSNPSKFRTGAVPIVADDEWRESRSLADKLSVPLATWPLMARYGYVFGR